MSAQYKVNAFCPGNEVGVGIFLLQVAQMTEAYHNVALLFVA